MQEETGKDSHPSALHSWCPPPRWLFSQPGKEQGGYLQGIFLQKRGEKLPEYSASSISASHGKGQGGDQIRWKRNASGTPEA